MMTYEEFNKAMNEKQMILILLRKKFYQSLKLLQELNLELQVLN
jgi:hypothetical protein